MVCSHLDFLFLSFLTIVGLNLFRNPSSIVHYLITFLAAYLIPFLCVTHYGLLFLSMPIYQKQVFHERKKNSGKNLEEGKNRKKKEKKIGKTFVLSAQVMPSSGKNPDALTYLSCKNTSKLICWTIHVYEDFGTQSNMGHLMIYTFLNVLMAYEIRSFSYSSHYVALEFVWLLSLAFHFPYGRRLSVYIAANISDAQKENPSGLGHSMLQVRRFSVELDTMVCLRT